VGIIESESKKAGGSIISGILDWLADFFDRISPQHIQARTEAADAKAKLDNAYNDLQLKYALLLTQYNNLQVERTAALNEQVVAEKQAEVDAKQVEVLKKDEDKVVKTIESKSDDTLLHDQF